MTGTGILIFRQMQDALALMTILKRYREEEAPEVEAGQVVAAGLLEEPVAVVEVSNAHGEKTC